MECCTKRTNTTCRKGRKNSEITKELLTFQCLCAILNMLGGLLAAHFHILLRSYYTPVTALASSDSKCLRVSSVLPYLE